MHRMSRSRKATHYITLHRAATCCNARQRTATKWNALQHKTRHTMLRSRKDTHYITLHCTATHCNTRQHAATRGNALQRSETHCNTRWCIQCYDLEIAKTAILQHTAIHCNTQHHTTTPSFRSHELQYTASHCYASIEMRHWMSRFRRHLHSQGP